MPPKILPRSKRDTRPNQRCRRIVVFEPGAICKDGWASLHTARRVSSKPQPQPVPVAATAAARSLRVKFKSRQINGQAMLLAIVVEVAQQQNNRGQYGYHNVSGVAHDVVLWHREAPLAS
jgi:hypothetical protein